MPQLPRLSFIVDHLLRQPKRISSVQIAAGKLIPETDGQIQSQWSMLIEGTLLARALLTIRRVPAEQQCMACFEKYQPLNMETSCPHCGSFGARIIAGEEFHLESLKEENE